MSHGLAVRAATVFVVVVAFACGGDDASNPNGAAGGDPDAGSSAAGDAANVSTDGGADDAATAAGDANVDGADAAPPAEICDGVDNDGNGKVDDQPTDTPPACPPRAGVCVSGGTATCAGASGWTCTYAATGYEAKETSCDALDNDCDGVVDEGCAACTSAERLWLASTSYSPWTFTASWVVRWIPPGATTGAITVASGSDGVDAVRVDAVHGKVYWIDSGLWRSNLDGTNKETIASGSMASAGLAIHPSGDWVYWSSISTIYRAPTANLTNVQTIVTGGVYIQHLVAIGDHLYWTDNPGIRRAKLDGTGVEAILPTTIAWALAVDIVDNRLYWVEAGKDPPIRYAALDGAGPKTLVSMKGINKVQDMVVDVYAKRIHVAAEGFLAEVGTNGTGLTLPSTGSNTTMDSIDLSGCKP